MVSEKIQGLFNRIAKIGDKDGYKKDSYINTDLEFAELGKTLSGSGSDSLTDDERDELLGLCISSTKETPKENGGGDNLETIDSDDEKNILRKLRDNYFTKEKEVTKINQELNNANSSTSSYGTVANISVSTLEERSRIMASRSAKIEKLKNIPIDKFTINIELNKDTFMNLVEGYLDEKPYQEEKVLSHLPFRSYYNKQVETLSTSVKAKAKEKIDTLKDVLLTHFNNKNKQYGIPKFIFEKSYTDALNTTIEETLKFFLTEGEDRPSSFLQCSIHIKSLVNNFIKKYNANIKNNIEEYQKQMNNGGQGSTLEIINKANGREINTGDLTVYPAETTDIADLYAKDGMIILHETESYDTNKFNDHTTRHLKQISDSIKNNLKNLGYNEQKLDKAIQEARIIFSFEDAKCVEEYKSGNDEPEDCAKKLYDNLVKNTDESNNCRQHKMIYSKNNAGSTPTYVYAISFRSYIDTIIEEYNKLQ